MPKEESTDYEEDTTTNTIGPSSPSSDCTACKEDFTSSDICPICNIDFYQDNKTLCVACDSCDKWFHIRCCGISVSDFPRVSAPSYNWYCPSCQCLRLPNFLPAAPLKTSWGKQSSQVLSETLSRILVSVSSFRPNLFKLPSGSSGKQFVAECTRLVKEWNSSSGLESVALTAIHLMGPLLLQNPGKKSKPGEHSAALLRRLPLWQAGEFDTLLSESLVIQSRLPQSTTSENRKGFARMMFAGRVGAALRLLSATPSASVSNFHQLQRKTIY